jgi:Holliday junction resolvase
MSERDIERDILEYLWMRGVFAWPTHSGKRMPVTPGVPDIIGVKDGRMIAVEVKTETGRVSKTQNEFHSKLMLHDAFLIVARSLDDVIAAGV